MSKKHNIYSTKSPSDIYVIYDQFHWGYKNRLVDKVKGWEEALKWYRFYKEAYKGQSLALTTLEYYEHMIKSYNFTKKND